LRADGDAIERNDRFPNPVKGPQLAQSSCSGTGNHDPMLPVAGRPLNVDNGWNFAAQRRQLNK
jgi:hypothetical protein